MTISGKAGAQTQIKSVWPWARTLLLGLCLFVSAFILYFYVLLFYASIVRAFGANFQLTWAHYRVVFTEGLKAIRDTLIIAGAGMPLGGIYAILLGYLVGKKVFPSRQAMEMVSMINYSLPGTIVGIAYLLAFNDPPIPHRALLESGDKANPDTAYDPELFRRDILPRLGTVRLAEIAQAAGCSKASASDIRRGKWTPHVSTWGALSELAGTLAG